MRQLYSIAHSGDQPLSTEERDVQKEGARKEEDKSFLAVHKEVLFSLLIIPS